MKEVGYLSCFGVSFLVRGALERCRYDFLLEFAKIFKDEIFFSKWEGNKRTDSYCWGAVGE